MDDSHLFPPDTYPDLRENCTPIRGRSAQWGCNWGLRDQNVTILHEGFQRAATPPGLVPRGEGIHDLMMLRAPSNDVRPRERLTGETKSWGPNAKFTRTASGKTSELNPVIAQEASKIFAQYAQRKPGEDGGGRPNLWHSGWRKLASDVGTFQKSKVTTAEVDGAFMSAAGWFRVMDKVVEAINTSDVPWDRAPPLPLFLTEEVFIERGIAAFADLLYPGNPDKIMMFCKWVLLPLAKRANPHPLYIHLYQPDCLVLLESYKPVLQNIFAHYAGLLDYLDAPAADHPALLQRAWGEGESNLRMNVGEFLSFLSNFGLIGSMCRTTPTDGYAKEFEFTPEMAMYIFQCASDGLETREQGTTLSYPEFQEALSRLACVLHPPEGLHFHDIQTAPCSLFTSLGTAKGLGRTKGSRPSTAQEVEGGRGAISPMLFTALSPQKVDRRPSTATYKVLANAGRTGRSGAGGRGGGSQQSWSSESNWGSQESESMTLGAPALGAIGGMAGGGWGLGEGAMPSVSQRLRKGPAPGYLRASPAKASSRLSWTVLEGFGGWDAGGQARSGGRARLMGSVETIRGDNEGYNAPFEPFARNFRQSGVLSRGN